ncbi:hypothetical protein [Mycobacterium sp. Z3061]|uniref:hypothetical protein n=1 Tax=Mycobacterium sp. Z3061 TaxID=3073562 RepID=UPI0028734719|nr:hypothetical protein [Mycobacterium sp. Z3061]
MTNSAELVAVELTEREREFIRQALQEWQNAAAWKPFPIHVLGLYEWSEFDELTDRLAQAVIGRRSLSVRDWALVLYLTECSWASSLVGAGLDFSTVSEFTDAQALGLLRGLQRKVGGMKYADALFPGRGRHRPVEQWKHESEKIIEEQRGRRYPPGL